MARHHEGSLARADRDEPRRIAVGCTEWNDAHLCDARSWAGYTRRRFHRWSSEVSIAVIGGRRSGARMVSLHDARFWRRHRLFPLKLSTDRLGSSRCGKLRQQFRVLTGEKLNA